MDKFAKSGFVVLFAFTAIVWGVAWCAPRAPAQDAFHLEPIFGLTCEASDYVRNFVESLQDAADGPQSAFDDAIAFINDNAGEPVCVIDRFFGTADGAPGAVIHDRSGQSWQLQQVLIYVKAKDDGTYEPIHPPAVRWTAVLQKDTPL